MAKCNFSIPFTGSTQDLVAKAQKAIVGAGGTFNGNDQSGSFTIPTPVGGIEGTYTITGSTINIAIDKKPFIVSCSKIENELRKYIGSTELQDARVDSTNLTESFHSELLTATETTDESLVTFTSFKAEYQKKSNTISLFFQVEAKNEKDEIWSVSPMVMSSQTLYALTQVGVANREGTVPFGISLQVINTSFFPVTDAIKGKTVQVGVAGFISTSDNPFAMFSKTVDLNIPS